MWQPAEKKVVIQCYGHKVFMIMFFGGGDRRQGCAGMYGILFTRHTLEKHKEERRW